MFHDSQSAHPPAGIDRNRFYWNYAGMDSNQKIAAIKRILADQSEDALVAAARKVVAARRYDGDDGWDRLKNAIGELEYIVGRPD